MPEVFIPEGREPLLDGDSLEPADRDWDLEVSSCASPSTPDAGSRLRMSKMSLGDLKEQHFSRVSTGLEFERVRARRLDEDLFIDALAVFYYIVPGWSEASIDVQGMLDLHGGPCTRAVPFLSILLVMPVFLLLPLAAIRHFLFHDATFTWCDVFVSLIRSFALSWLAWGPVLYLALGTPVEDFENGCTTPLIISFPLAMLAWCGYALTNKHLCSSCDEAVEECKAEVQEEGEEWFKATIESLSCPADGTSFYPVYVSGLDKEPVHRPLSLESNLSIMAVVVVQAAYALHPIFFIESMNGWCLTMNLTAAACIAFTSFCFWEDLAQKMADFRRCIAEVEMILFLASPAEVRFSRRRREHHLSHLREIAKMKCILSSETTRSGAAIEVPEEQWMRRVAKRSTLNIQEVTSIKEDLPLDIRRLELDLSTLNGIHAFQHLQNWVSADIVNERFSLDTSASIVLVMVLALLAVLVNTIVQQYFADRAAGAHIPRVTVTELLLVLDLAAMLVFIGLACNACIEMNELLFAEADRVLLLWKDHARQPNATFAKVWFRGKQADFTGQENRNSSNVNRKLSRWNLEAGGANLPIVSTVVHPLRRLQSRDRSSDSLNNKVATSPKLAPPVLSPPLLASRAIVNGPAIVQRPNSANLKVELPPLPKKEDNQEIMSFEAAAEIRAKLDITRERLRLQDPQRLLGMKVTKSLRAQLLSGLGTLAGAITCALIKKELGGGS